MTDANTLIDLLRLAGRLLHGERWQEPLARDLGVSGRQCRYWDAGRALPDDLPGRLGALLGRRATELAGAVDRCAELAGRVGAVASARRAARVGRPGGENDMGDGRRAMGAAEAAFVRDLFASGGRARVRSDAVWADDGDLEGMRAKGFLTMPGVGRVPSSGIPLGSGLELGPGLTAVLLGGPGVGKGTMFVVPAILAARGLVAQDGKGDLLGLTGPDRANRGVVARLDWDDDTVGGAEVNLLAAPFLPTPGRGRWEYLAAVARCLVPPEGGDEYFRERARAAIAGLLAAAVEVDPGDREAVGMPEVERGREPSLPGVAGWLTEARGFAGGGQGAIDAWLDAIRRHVAETWDGLAALRAMGAREQAGVIGEMHRALDPLAWEPVAGNLRGSSFAPGDLRGVRDGEGGWRPFALYLTTSGRGGRTHGALDAAVVAALAHHLLATVPSGRGLDGEELGPHDVTIVLDEATKGPFGPTAREVSRLGPRGGVAQLVVGQDAAQLARHGFEGILDDAHAIVVACPDQPELRSALADMVGSRDGTRPDDRGAAAVVVVRGHADRPILTAPRPWYLYPEVAARVTSPRAQEPDAAAGRTAPRVPAGDAGLREVMARVATRHGGTALTEAVAFARGEGGAPNPASEDVAGVLASHGGAAVADALAWLRGDRAA